MSHVVRTFLPWYRSGHAAALAGTLAAGRSRAAVPAGVRLRDETGRGRVGVPLALAGPGDVLGLDPREVLRTEPFDGSADFEPSYFPYVELRSLDLPWRFTPEGPASAPLTRQGDGAVLEQQRVRPWIALVVVPSEFATLTAATGSLPATLRCPAAELPDASEAWAWAHVQVAHDAAEPVTAELARSGTARLVCPRRLEGGVHYVACLVPTFAAGRAVLEAPALAEPLAPAWSADDGDVELPVYLTWAFTTGQDGSFEALVRRLRPRPVPDSAAGRAVGTASPGWGAHGHPEGRVLMQGALRPVTGAEQRLADDDLAASLRQAVSTTGAGAQLRPPLYGQDYQHGVTALPPQGAGHGWLDQLNSDPRRRAAAGLAAWAVAVNQEELVDEAWRQLAQAQVPRPGEPDPALGRLVNDVLTVRHDVAVRLTAAVPTLTRLLRRAASSPSLPALSALSAPSAMSAASAVPGSPVTETGATPSAGTAFAPQYDVAGYALLRSVAPEWLFPAVGDLPPDTVAVARTNTAFVESFMVGLNHAIARELQWRRFPVRADATFVPAFWGAPGGGAADLPPIGAWQVADDLGSHLVGGDRLVLVLRGVLLRRFPTAAVYLARTRSGAEEALQPAFAGRVGTDTTFLGFPLTAEQALDTAHGGAEAWSVVVQEAVSHTRFGVGDPPDGTGGAGGDPPSWQDLDWSHAQLAGRRTVPVAGPLMGLQLPAARGSADTAVWGLDAAQLAIALQQPAFRVRIPLTLWLSEEA